MLKEKENKTYLHFESCNNHLWTLGGRTYPQTSVWNLSEPCDPVMVRWLRCILRSASLGELIPVGVSHAVLAWAQMNIFLQTTRQSILPPSTYVLSLKWEEWHAAPPESYMRLEFATAIYSHLIHDIALVRLLAYSLPDDVHTLLNDIMPRPSWCGQSCYNSPTTLPGSISRGNSLGR